MSHMSNGVVGLYRSVAVCTRLSSFSSTRFMKSPICIALHPTEALRLLRLITVDFTLTYRRGVTM